MDLTVQALKSRRCGADYHHVEQLTVKRWRRYGKDRLYVTANDGSQVGWYDLLTGQTHPERPAGADSIECAVQQWRAGTSDEDSGSARLPGMETHPPVLHEAPVPSPPSAGASGSTTDRAESPADLDQAPPQEDLAARGPGAAAREQALALKQAAPVRTFLARALGVHNEERAWRIGADGEQKVAARLAKLIKKDPHWRVLHAIPVGERGSDIDHLVIGPGGVYSLNTKHHPGAKIWIATNTFMVNGHPQPYVRNSRHEAQRASRLLSTATGRTVTVTAVIVLVGPESITIKEAPDGVHVASCTRIAKWLVNRPEVLDHESIDAIYTPARNPTTWHQPSAT